jgi:3-dehydroquinate dehydratase-2
MPCMLVLQGANMHWLGIRESEIYGTTTAAELEEQIHAYACKTGFEVEIYDTNLEGETLNQIAVISSGSPSSRLPGGPSPLW